MELRRVEQTLESHPAFTSGSLLLAVLLLASVLGMAAQSAQASEVVVLGEWPTAGRDGARSSSTAEAAPPEPFFSWYFDRSQYDATVSGNRVYVGGLTTSTLQYSGNAGRALYALDATTGNVIWQRPLYADADPALSPGFRIGVPTVQGTRVYVADSAGYLWSVNAADGSVAWKVYSGGDLFLVESSLLVTGDRIYALLDKNPSPSYGEFVLKALRTTDGAVVWETTNGVAKVGAYGNLATDGTRIFAGGQGLVAWNAANGTKLWELSPNETLSAPAVGTGLVYVTGA
ncbi:MAG: outer membrane protein assembly factor BamB family protein, partial [Methanobacteriota archaeon]